MFENATKLTRDITKRFGIQQELPDDKYDEYYLNICQLVWDCHWAKPTAEQIEQFITDGQFTLGNEVVKSPVTNAEMRRDLFLSAQAKQLQYDMLSGRGAMLRGEDTKFNACPDTLGRLKSLGLYQRNYMTV